MAQICTTREQSQKLLELGIKSNTADMSWHFTNSRAESLQWELKTFRLTTKENFFGKIEKLATPFFKHADGTPMTGEEVFDKIYGKDLPAWSLGSLIALMPSEIHNCHRKKYFKLEHERVSYFDKDEIYGFSLYVENNLFDACVSMIERLVKHRHIKV